MTKIKATYFCSMFNFFETCTGTILQKFYFKIVVLVEYLTVIELLYRAVVVFANSNTVVVKQWS